MANRNLLPIYKKLFGEDFSYGDFENRMRMQKAVYLLQDMGVPVGHYGFSWYHYGPYSQDLQDDMFEEDRKSATDAEVLASYERRISRVYDLIHAAGRGSYSLTQWLECLASIHFLRENIMDYDATMEDTLEELARVKPKLADREANIAAYRHLDWVLENTQVKTRKKGNGKIVFEGQILDNVHGFISYTKAEKDIMNTQLFRRLQNIKQLSVVNWVFPGSEHTRFIHSLGVMHIADKIALTLGLNNRERRILRLAGLLHDVGHYPLSHVAETPYDKEIGPGEVADSREFCRLINEKVVEKIDSFTIEGNKDPMTTRQGMHHEAVGGRIVISDPEISGILVRELGSDAPRIIADIITGKADRKLTDPLLVQIMHSELDADGIDYIMRDSASAGTNFGACEIDQLIRCMVVGKYKGKRILCIRPKGIPAADQYLINKFFHYSQVIFNRHIVISEWMAEQVISWMNRNDVYFPTAVDLCDWSERGVGEEYLAFNDNLFWTALDHLRRNELPKAAPDRTLPMPASVPDHIRLFCEFLLTHDEPEVAKRHEIRIVSDNQAAIRRRLKQSETWKHHEHHPEWITIVSKRTMSGQIPEKQFNALLDGPNAAALTPADKEKKRIARMMESIAVRDHDHKVHALVDDERSLMRTMHKQTVVILRSYEFPHNKLKK